MQLLGHGKGWQRFDWRFHTAGPEIGVYDYRSAKGFAMAIKLGKYFLSQHEACISSHVII